ncbi:exosortase F system-associated membrane protein [Salinimicrobium flavum]|uniref:Exosortase F system-associated protein n=1 Tax=Salinimicrobium flavum TaxID=1737065 RepID=A0ABW5IU60_9FLAO
MKPLVRVAIILFLVGVLALIRLYEYDLFYDPFMYFFEIAVTGKDLNVPSYMYFNLFVRFLLNTGISLLILQVAFHNRGIIKFATGIYLAFFLAFFPIFIFLMHRVQPDDYLAAFHVRRFLAHPVLVLILLPAFYYYRLKQKEIG